MRLLDTSTGTGRSPRQRGRCVALTPLPRGAGRGGARKTVMALSRAERCLALLLRLLSRACLALLALLPPPRAGPARAAPRAVPPPRCALLLLPARRLAELLRARQVPPAALGGGARAAGLGPPSAPT